MEAEPEDDLDLDPLLVGPSWQRDPEHPSGWFLPRLSLGWAIADWQHGRLQHGNGSPWRYTPEQFRLLLWWYAVDDDLNFVFRDGVLQRLKGWGKDPFGATLCATELVGPCRPDRSGRTFDAGGWAGEQPAGVPHPEAWVQVAAVAKDQTRNTMTLFPGLFTKKCVEEYAIDLGKEIIYALHGQRRLEAVTSSPRALEGARSTFTLKNETHHWLANNEGHDMADVIERNATKSPDGSSRAFSITNAFEPGEDSVAERERDAYDAIEAKRTMATGIFYDSIEAPPAAPLSAEVAPLVVEKIRGDSTWLQPDRIVQSIVDPRNLPSRSRRFWYNQITAVEDAWVAPFEWDAGAWPQFTVPLGATVTIGFDGSLSDDHSALIGCHVEFDHLFEIEVWEPGDDGRIDRADIDRVVRRTFDEYDVVGFYSDLHPFESYVDRWAEDLGDELLVRSESRHPVAYDIRKRGRQFTVACESLQAAIIESAEQATTVDAAKRLTHCGSSRFRQHVHNARRAPNQWGISVRKEHRESKRKIDSVPAAVLARRARQDYLALPESKRKRTKRSGKVW